MDPVLREKLLEESRNPFRGLRRGLWIAGLGSACIGIFVMLSRILSGSSLSSEDLGIQLAAVMIFGLLFWFDKGKVD